MKVYWTETAIGHLANIYEYIGLNSQTYARRMVDRITRRSEQIADHPLSGRKVPEYDAEDIRELIEKPYRLIYRIKPDQIDILAVIHGAMLLPEDF
ncbi:MAG: type II toxin-antitoxin system RelE/ParE family toxin [Desulfobacteraceae bacterium]|nr:type II toxin-antitoxin system RelE/ParE family toxin [Desulfobacteraceae bacterium]